jgi:hypothetical protein
MADVNAPQKEIDMLFELPKTKVDETIYDYPPLGGNISIPLVSKDKRENFILDISRSCINLQRGKYQNRSRIVVVLARLDFGGPAHMNPDEKIILCPHLHLYREGYGDKWAYPIPLDEFSDITNLSQTLDDFMRFCHIIEPPNIRKGLFV